MPFDASDARKHTKKAKTAAQKRQWAHIANQSLGKGESDATAIRKANAVARSRKKRAD